MFWDSSGAAVPVTAAAGVDQGCPLSPLLFAFGIASEQFNTKLKVLDPSCKMLARLDDIIAVAPRHLAKQAHDVVKTSMDAFGLLALNDDSGVPLRPSISIKRSPSLKVLGGQNSWLDREDLLTPVHGAVGPGPVLQATCLSSAWLMHRLRGRLSDWKGAWNSAGRWDLSSRRWKGTGGAKSR